MFALFALLVTPQAGVYEDVDDAMHGAPARPPQKRVAELSGPNDTAA